MIIGLTGKKGAGKDLVGSYLQEKYKFNRIAFATPLKEFTKQLFRLSDKQLWGTIEQKETIDPRYDRCPRELLIELAEIGRALDPECWVKLAIKQLVPNQHNVVTDVRYINEAKAIWSVGGKVIRILRPFSTGKLENVTSETEQDAIHPDYTIYNDTDIDSLYREIDRQVTMWR